jgi:pimeloyl-ACP methyl ester carboxylesterase
MTPLSSQSSEVWRHQRSRSGPNKQPPESSHLADAVDALCERRALAVDDHSRIATAAIFPDERKKSAVAFLRSAVAYYRSLGITGGVALVGGSMGGVVAQHLVLRHPSRVLRLLLVMRWPMALKQPSFLMSTWANSQPGPSPLPRVALAAAIAKGFFRQPSPPHELALYKQIALSASKTAAVQAARSNAILRTLERLGERAHAHHPRALRPRPHTGTWSLDVWAHA